MPYHAWEKRKLAALYTVAAYSMFQPPLNQMPVLLLRQRVTLPA